MEWAPPKSLLAKGEWLNCYVNGFYYKILTEMYKQCFIFERGR